MVERDEDIIWENTDHTVRLTKFSDHLLIQTAFKDVLRRPVLNEEDFTALCQAGAAYFGKRFKVEDIPYTCPHCGSEKFQLVPFFGRRDSYVWQCKGCGISGPTTPFREDAPELFREMFNGHN